MVVLTRSDGAFLLRVNGLLFSRLNSPFPEFHSLYCIKREPTGRNRWWERWVGAMGGARQIC